MKIKKLVSIVAVTAITAASFSGCSGKNTETDASDKLTYWTPLASSAASRFSNFGETKLANELKNRLGVELEYVHPPQGQDSEKFSIMVASNDLPDIIVYNWMKYPGGPSKAIKENVIIDIAKHKDEATNLFAYLDEHENVKKLATTDFGEVFSFPYIRGDESLNFSSGLIIRGDWLDELNLKMPETIEDWETVLTAFKNKKGAAAPFSSNNTNMFASAFDTNVGYYVENGKVKYGAEDESFKDYLETMNRWYSAGLIDPSFATLDSKTIQSNILNDVSGATVGSVGSGIGNWMSAATGDNPSYSLEGAPVPVPKAGARAKFGNYQLTIPSSTTAFAAITTNCKNVEKAVKFLDYGYSEEGQMLYNFGIEGESYEMVDGYPTYTEEITNNSEGLSMTTALSDYTLAYSSGPFIQDKRYMEQYAQLPQQKRAWETWSNTDVADYILPYLFVEEGQMTEYAQIGNDIDTYASEMISKFIIGEIPISEYDNMVSGLKQRGLDKILEMKQAAYQRYLDK